MTAFAMPTAESNVDSSANFTYLFLAHGSMSIGTRQLEWTDDRIRVSTTDIFAQPVEVWSYLKERKKERKTKHRTVLHDNRNIFFTSHDYIHC